MDGARLSTRAPPRLLVFDDQWIAAGGATIAGTEASAIVFGELCEYFPHVSVLGRTQEHRPHVRYPLPRHVRHIPLPAYRNVGELCTRFPTYARAVLRSVGASLRGADVMLLCWPHPLSFLLVCAAAFRRAEIAAVLLVRADMRQCVTLRYRGFKRFCGTAAIGLMEWLVRRLQPRATVLAAGDALRRQYAAGFVDVRTVASSAITIAQLRRAARRPPRDHAGPFRLVFVGRLEPEKCVSELLDAVAQLIREGVAVELEVIGDGGERQRLGAHAEALDIKQVVRFTGEIAYGPALLERIAAAEALVLCSRTEGLPSVLLEAASVGTAIITSAVGGIPSVLQDGVHALLYDLREPDGLIVALRRALKRRTALPATSDAACAALAPFACENQVRIMHDALRHAGSGAAAHGLHLEPQILQTPE